MTGKFAQNGLAYRSSDEEIQGSVWHFPFPSVEESKTTAGRTRPVSYTHLDVYKRQYQNHANCHRQNFTVDILVHCGIISSIGRKGHIGPVSYTHLDVYKRQPLPNPEKPKGRNNNRKQTFDAVCRTILFDIARRHGLHLDQEPSYGGRDYLEKQDYILMKQKEQLATQEQKLEELTLKIEDVETLLEDVSGAAYDKAVEVVTDKVREQTQLEDMEVIEKYRKSVVSPNAKNSPEVVKIANTLLSRVREKLQQSAEKVLKKVQSVLLKPEVKQAGKEQIKNKARKSIKEKLAQGKLDADRENRERWEREGRIASTRKQDMEL